MRKVLQANILKRAINRLIQKNYYTAKAYSHYKMRRSSHQYKEPPLLVYQMGKVGSSTVVESLNALRLDMPIYHVHYLSQGIMARNEKKYKAYFGTWKGREFSHIWRYQYLRKQIERGLKKKWKIVTLTRDPIARNISAFFQNLVIEFSDSNHQYKIKSIYDFEITINIEDIEKLIKFFLEKFDHETPLVFFDRELKGVFGIDVFSSEFPKSKGYKIYEGEQADVLLIRLENLNECAADAFKEFLNIEGFTLINTNIGSQKDHAVIYQKLLNSITLPDFYIDEMCTSRYARHFYSEEEIDMFKARWRRQNII